MNKNLVRIPVRILNDPSWGLLPDWLWRANIELIMLADPKSGALPCFDDLSWLLRKPPAELRKIIDDLTSINFVEFTPSGLIHKKYLEIENEIATFRQPIPDKLRAEVLERDGYICRYCGEPAEHIDHVKPVAQGGRNEIENLVASCAKCNMYKKAKTPEEAGLTLRPI